MSPTMTGTNKADMQQLLDDYLGAWNEPDPAERARLLQRSVCDDVVFADPMARTDGRDALARHITRTRADYPDVSFGPSGELDSNANGFFRQLWVARGSDGILLRGLDVYEVAADGRLSRILGFFDPAR
jgi:SnoaL-like protein